MEPKVIVESNVQIFENSKMKIVLRLCALLISSTMLFMGLETLLPQFPEFLNKSTATIFIIVGLFLGYYGVTGRSSIIKSKK